MKTCVTDLSFMKLRNIPRIPSARNLRPSSKVTDTSCRASGGALVEATGPQPPASADHPLRSWTRTLIFNVERSSTPATHVLQLPGAIRMQRQCQHLPHVTPSAADGSGPNYSMKDREENISNRHGGVREQDHRSKNYCPILVPVSISTSAQ